MFGPGGRAFVYITYGIHHMFNTVTESAGFPSGVLIRAVEPLENVERDTRGPGLLTRALDIDRALDGSHLRTGPLRVLAGSPRPEERIERSSRIGIAGAGPEAVERAWRFYLAGNAYLSRGRPTTPTQVRNLIATRAARRAKLPRQ
jgi:DNA-3-methyladenine glycosylase